MTCEELRDHYELYVLGVADEDEAAEIRSHLGRKCEVCAAGLKSARELTALLAATAPPASPRPELRKRILASVGDVSEARVAKAGFRWGPLWAALAFVSAGAAIYLEVRVKQVTDESAGLRTDLNRQIAEAAQRDSQLERLNAALAIVNATETIEVTFGPDQPKPGGRVFVSPQQGVLLVASRLPAAPTGKIYEMWIIPRQGLPAPAGLFQSNPDGSAFHLQTGPVDVAATGAVAVTLEDAAGAPQPTSTPLIVAALMPPRANR